MSLNRVDMLKITLAPKKVRKARWPKKNKGDGKFIYIRWLQPWCYVRRVCLSGTRRCLISIRLWPLRRETVHASWLVRMGRCVLIGHRTCRLMTQARESIDTTRAGIIGSAAEVTIHTWTFIMSKLEAVFMANALNNAFHFFLKKTHTSCSTSDSKTCLCWEWLRVFTWFWSKRLKTVTFN